MNGKLSAEDPNSPQLAKMQAVLNYNDPEGSNNRETRVNGIYLKLRENSSLDLKSIYLTEGRLLLNATTAADRAGYNGLYLVSSYRGADQSPHDGRALDVAHGYWTSTDPNTGKTIQHTDYFGREYVNGSWTQPDAPQRLNAMIDHYRALEGSNQVLSPWSNWALWMNGENPYDSLLDTYPWVGDFDKRTGQWVNKESHDKFWSDEYTWMRGQLNLDRQHADHLHLSVSGIN